MATPLIVAAAVASAALVPVLGEYTPAMLLIGAGLALTQRLPVRFQQLKGYAMSAARLPAGKERRQIPRRDEDKAPMERIKALEEGQAQQGKTINKALKKIDRHIVGCESSAAKNEADNAKIIKTQAETTGKVQELLVKQDAQTETLTQHTETMTGLSEVLPWLKQNYENKKARDQMWRAMGDFVLGMARKNWDSISGKLIFFVIAGVLFYLGLPWQHWLAVMLGG
jgi:hypothetical protein